MISFDSIWERYREFDTRIPYLSPAVATTFFSVFLIMDLRVEPTPGSEFKQEETLGVLLAATQVWPLLFMRRAPLTALTVTFAAFVAHSILDHQVLWVAQFAVLILLYHVASATNDRKSLVGAAVSATGMVVGLGIFHKNPGDAVVFILFLGCVWVVGNIVRSRRDKLEIAELTVTELSEEQERATREATNDERARIARELHDIVGHALNLVVIQAGAAQRVFSASPEKSLETMKSVETNGRQALSDVDKMLGILRSPHETAGTLPQLESRPSIGRVESLVEQLRGTGQSIELAISGALVTLAPSTDLSAYRVVQEALTNVMTHASGSKASVEVEYSDDLLSVKITNDDSGIDKFANRTGGGRGIIGMRERTSLFGGEFEAGSTDDGGWRVHATFPIGNSSSDGGVK